MPTDPGQNTSSSLQRFLYLSSRPRSRLRTDQWLSLLSNRRRRQEPKREYLRSSEPWKLARFNCTRMNPIGRLAPTSTRALRVGLGRRTVVMAFFNVDWEVELEDLSACTLVGEIRRSTPCVPLLDLQLFGSRSEPALSLSSTCLHTEASIGCSLPSLWSSLHGKFSCAIVLPLFHALSRFVLRVVHFSVSCRPKTEA
jgi:hypothetical protein